MTEAAATVAPVEVMRGAMAGLALIAILVAAIGALLGVLALLDGDRDGLWAIGCGIVLGCVSVLLLVVVRVDR